MTIYRYRLLAETITRNENGDTVEGLNGLLDALDEFVAIDGYTGSVAAKILDENTREADGFASVLDVLDDYGAADSVDVRGRDEMIVYLADLPAVDDDEPYVRAIWVQGPYASELLDDHALAEAYEIGEGLALTMASWIELDPSDARMIIDDVDPEIMDRLEPRAPLSGEFADDYLLISLASDLNVDDDEIGPYADALEEGYYETWYAELERIAAETLKLDA